MGTTRRGRQTGSALLAVLWLSAALAAIALTVANSIRAETERTSTEVEGLRAYYLAAGSIDRALLWIEWGPGPRNPDGSPRYFQNPMPVLRFQYPAGVAQVEIIPETAKLNINTATPEDLTNVLLAAGTPPDRVFGMVAAIVDWRTPSPGGSFTALDQFYLGLTPSFRARHASFEEIEELLLVQGMTPDLFYGSYTRNLQGGLVRHDGLKDCLSVYGVTGSFDINTVSPTLMTALGIPPNVAGALVALRAATPIKTLDQVAAFAGGSPAVGRLAISPSTMVTLRATARAKLPNGQLSDLQRSVSALIAFLPADRFSPAYQIMRWYDNSPSLQ